jgi:energy-coupling factor transporter ATP-binding protein EcfA2
MNNSEQQSVVENKIQDSLQYDIKKFANALSQWGQVIAAAILAGREVSDSDMENAYQILLEELKILPETTRAKININFDNSNGIHFQQLKFKELRDTEGINALAEKQIIQFGDNLTIVYGTNGAGKSGYVRLLKKLFYTKSREEILHNIHLQDRKKPAAIFVFDTGDQKLELKYPADIANPVFTQFSVFDGKGVLSHLDQKNALEFRPAGLSFFSRYTEAIKKLEIKLQEAIKLKQGINPFPDLFDGDSEIKILINGLSASTKITDLKKFLPFTEEDQRNKKKAETDYDDVLVASKSKDKEITQLEVIKQSLQQTKINIEKLNKFFSEEALKKVSTIINDYSIKKKLAENEGVEQFKSELLAEIGSPEWKSFIVAANAFAEKQKSNGVYPQDNDCCLLCHQPLSDEARELIKKYWAFIKSEAEKKAAEANAQVQQAKLAFGKLVFDQFQEGNVLTVWMTDKKAAELNTLTIALNKLQNLRNEIVGDLDNITATPRNPLQVDVSIFDAICNYIDEKIKSFKDDEQQKELARLLRIKTLFAHREKLQQRIIEIESFVDKLIWISKAGKVNWGKRAVTEAEKELSGKYFNQKYIDTFNEECKSLDGNFGIIVNHTGSAGSSYRQLSLKGNSPSAILSEGEQKVIAIADFVAEMRMSEINRGMIFDDPVNSLDEHRKKRIAEHLAELSKQRQIIIFSHDLVFVSALISYCQDLKITFESHWVEKRDDKPGMVFLNNSPSYENDYRKNTIPMKHYSEAKKDDCPPAQREYLIKAGFTALRTCYEVLVIKDLFKNVVQRFNERVSIDSLSSVYFDQSIVDEIMDSFARCCRYMEGHTHSDKYGYRKPELKDIKEEIDRFDAIKKKIKDTKRPTEATV